MIKRKTMMICLVAALGFSAAAQSGDSDTWGLWSSGYENYENGKKAKSQKRYKEALELLEKSREFYLEVKRNRPDWNQNVIDNRIALVENDIIVLKKTLEGSVGEDGVSVAPSVKDDKIVIPAPPAEAVRTSMVNTRQLKELTAERDSYKQRTQELGREIETIKIRERANAATLQELENLVGENRKLQDKISLLEQQIAALERRAAQPDVEKTALNNQLIQEKIKSETLQKQLDLSKHETLQSIEESSGAIRERNLLRIVERDLSAKLGVVERELGALRNRRVFEESERRAAADTLTAKEKELKVIADELAVTSASLEDVRKQYAELLSDPTLSGRESADVLQENIALQDELLKLRTSNSSLHARNVAIELDNVSKTSEVEDLKKFLQQLDAKAKVAAEESRIYRIELEKEQQNVAELAGASGALKQRMSQLESSLLAMNGENEQLKKSLSSGSRDVKNMVDLNTQNQELAGKVAELTTKLDSLRLYSNSNDVKLAAAKNEVEQLQIECATGRSAMDALKLAEAKIVKLELDVNSLTAKNDEFARLTAVLKSESEKLSADVRISAEVQSGLPLLKQNLAETQRKNQELINELEGSKRAGMKLQEESAKQQDVLFGRIEALVGQNEMLRSTLKSRDALPEIDELEELELAPTTMSRRVQVAEMLADAAESDTPELAMYHLRKANSLEPGNPDICADLGMLELISGDAEKAEKLLATAVAEYGDDPKLVAAYVGLLLNSDRAGNALLILEKALKTNPDNYRLLLLRGSSLWRIGTLSEAEDKLVELTENYPQTPDAYCELALMLAKTSGERQSEAAGLYSTSKQLGGRVNVYLEEALKNALLENRETVDFLYASGAEAGAAGEWAAAMWFYRELCGIEKHRELPRFLLTLSLIGQNLPDEALKVVGNASTPVQYGLKLLAIYQKNWRAWE